MIAKFMVIIFPVFVNCIKSTSVITISHSLLRTTVQPLKLCEDPRFNSNKTLVNFCSSMDEIRIKFGVNV